MRGVRRLVLLLGVVVLAGALGYASLPVGTAPSSGPRASAGKARAAESRGGFFSLGGLLSGSGGEGGGEERRGRWAFSLGGWGLPGFGAEGECWLSGQVTDEDGRPVAGAEVIVKDSDGPFVGVWEGAETDGEGRYRLGPLVPGLYLVEADAPGYVARKLTGQLLTSAEETLDLELRDAVLVEGTVVDEDGRPLGGVSLFLFDPTAERESRALSYGKSGEDGSFSLDAPEPGRYGVKLSLQDFLDTEHSVTAPERSARLVLKAGAWVEVEVVDEAGRPVAGARVDVEPMGPERYPDKGGTTDEAGKWTLKGLAPGKHGVSAVSPEDGPLRTARQEVELRGSERRQVRLRFEEGLKLSGVVVDAKGRPVEGAEVRVAPEVMVDSRESEDPEWAPFSERLEKDWFHEPAAPRLTGRDGRFTVPHLRQGTWLVTALKEGHSFEGKATGRKVRWLGPLTGVLVEAGASDVKLVLAGLGYVRGRVVRADGSPVTRYQLNERPVEDAKGEFRWPIYATGEEVLAFAVQEGLAGTVRKVKVKEGEDLDVGEVVLREGREVRVRVVDAATSEPVVGARLDLRDAEDSNPDDERSLFYRDSAELVRTGQDGTVTLPHVEERSLLLRVTHADYLDASVRLDAKQREATVSLHGGAWLDGEVRAGGERLESGSVEVRTQEGEFVNYARVVDGSYVVGPLAAGRYVLQADTYAESTPPVFVPKPVDVPATGTVTVNLEAQEHGTNVEVRASEQVGEVILVPGAQPLPGTHEQGWATFAFGFRNRGSLDGRFSFRLVPAGRYTLFAVRDWHESTLEMHREEVEVPVTESVSLTLQPQWQRLQGESSE